MKTVYYIFVLILFIQNTGNAQKEQYYSKQEEKYFRKSTEKPFKPQEAKDILDFYSPGIKIDSLADYSLFRNINSRQHYLDSLEVSPEEKDISGILKQQIIKREEKDGFSIVLYEDPTYDAVYSGEKGYWLAIKKDNRWEKYYTGLTVNMPLHFKWNSRLPLIKNKNTLQIEAAILQLVQKGEYKNKAPKYELLKDGIVVEITLDSVFKDSDRDGFSDIVEKKLMLNPNRADTDGDRIVDYLDFNPRFINEKTNVSLVYETILQCFDNQDLCRDTIIKIESLNPIRKISDTTKTYLIVSDDTELHKINPQKHRFIILTSKEYELYKEQYYNTIPRCDITPFFLIDDMENSRKIHISCGSGGIIYLVTRHKYVWEIKVLSVWSF